MKIENIKYRAWDGYDLRYSDEFLSLEAFFAITDDGGYGDVRTEYNRWTRVSDINRKLIYFGDIVIEKGSKANRGPCYLVTEGGILDKRGNCNDEYYGNIPTLHCDLVVVGNIYENPGFGFDYNDIAKNFWYI